MSSMCLEFTIKNILPKWIGFDLWLMELEESIYQVGNFDTNYISFRNVENL
jgi:hypothetical protein